MAQYQFGEDENTTESMQALLALAGEERVGDVQYQPGVGTSGAVNLPQDLYDEWVAIKAEHDASRAAESEDDAADEDDDNETADEEQPSKPAGRTSRRGAAAKE